MDGGGEDGQQDAQAPERVSGSLPEDTRAYTLSVAAAAAQLGRSENTVRRLIRQRLLAATLVPGERGDVYRLRPEDVEDARGRLDAHMVSRSATQAPMSAQAPRRPATQAPMSASGDLVGMSTQSAALALIEEVATSRETIARLAEELGAARERARRAQADADQARAQLQAYTQAEQEKRETEAYAQARALLAQSYARQRAEWKAQHRPWWAFWRPGPPRRDSQDDQ